MLENLQRLLATAILIGPAIWYAIRLERDDPAIRERRSAAGVHEQWPDRAEWMRRLKKTGLIFLASIPLAILAVLPEL